MNIQINFSVDEINKLLSILGNTPSSTGAYAFMVKIEQEARQSVAAANAGMPKDPPANFKAQQNEELGKQVMSPGV